MAIKVCHMTSSHNPKDQRIFHKQCVSLAKAGYDVYLVERGDSEELNGVHIVGTGEENQNRFFRLLKRPQNIYKLALALDADIYQIHDMELLPFALKLKRKGKKVIFDSHEDFVTGFSDSDALPLPKCVMNLLGRIYGWYENYVCRRLDAVISVTPHICDRFVKVNPNTVMVTNYPMLDTGAWKEEMPYHPDSNYVAFAGQITEAYSVPFIARALQNVEGIEFHLCGRYRSESEVEQVKAQDEKGIVKYLGVLPYGEVPTFFNHARAAIVIPVYSSYTGGKMGTIGSNKLFEAMLCGVPVICTDFVLWRELVDRYHCGICVDPSDEMQLVNAVRYILDHPEEADEMGQNGRKAILEQYNWNTQEQVLLDLYKRLSEGGL